MGESDDTDTGETHGGSDGEHPLETDEELAEPVETPAPADAFDLLRDETRLSILQVLAEKRRVNYQFDGLSFAELRKAVGVRDAGNFSYHLDKLEGTFVVEHEGEYKLLNRGLELLGALEAGSYTESGERRLAETDYECPQPNCDRNLEAVYEYQFFRHRCPDHGIYQGAGLSPGLADHHTLEELVEIATLENNQEVERARAGICPDCQGPIEVTFPATDPEFPDGTATLPDDALLAGFDCDRCGLQFWVPPGSCVVRHPAVVSLYHDHGEDVRQRPYIELPFMSVLNGTVESDDPVRVRVDVDYEDDHLELWLDETTQVLDYERT